jgi:hypothetical protein
MQMLMLGFDGNKYLRPEDRSISLNSKAVRDPEEAKLLRGFARMFVRYGLEIAVSSKNRVLWDLEELRSSKIEPHSVQ